MKLYAIVDSERMSRQVKKGGDEFLSINLTRNNSLQYIVEFNNGKIEIKRPVRPFNSTGPYVETVFKQKH